MHLTCPHLCSVGDCRRCFKTEEELKDHQKFHKVDGFQCEHCNKIFRLRYKRMRHVVRIHQNVRRKSDDILSERRMRLPDSHESY